jgi:hypothetical protein
MEFTQKINKSQLIVGFLLAISWLFWFTLKQNYPADPGDGVMHFFLSNAAFEKPELFLNHWGKPLFILCSAPFAQIGLKGIQWFNFLLFCGQLIFIYKVLKHFKVTESLIAIAPILLLSSQDYSMTHVAGLTEPFFNFLLVVATWLWIQKKYLWFALIVSLLPFARSEGMLVVLLGFVLLIIHKQLKYVPFLFLGFLIYSCIGAVVYEEFWWYFTQSPYQMSNGIYGVGTWEHYFISYKNYLGNPMLYLFILALFSFLILVVKRKLNLVFTLELFWMWCIYFGILFSHIYFFALGKNGAAGLTRLATQGLPLLLIGLMIILQSNPWFSNKWVKGLFLVFGGIVFVSLVKTKHFPVHLNGLEQLIVKEAPVWHKKYLYNKKTYAFYPLFAYTLKSNPLKQKQDIANKIEKDLKSFDYIVWDSHFGPREAGLSLQQLENKSNYTLIEQKTASFSKEEPHVKVELKLFKVIK